MISEADDRKNPWIYSFSSLEASCEKSGLSLVGGKGANLARLSQAGFAVPPGFLISTQAYQDFIQANQLETAIMSALPQQTNADMATLEAAASAIRAMFTSSKMPDSLENEIVSAYHGMYGGPVAVRSSATAEDLPDMSFAGQQDTYLNVLGSRHLLDAVVNCWSSLWTARAIGYRIRNHVPHKGAALAVVVQRMVESEASGVLFTANPLTGLRSEMVIDATLGLGEALVSGKVDPDHYVVDAGEMSIVSKTLGAKALAVQPQAGGGTIEVQQAAQALQALPDRQILALAAMGKQVAELYHEPQDIEWAWADGKLFLLQSRAITSLYPTPEGVPAEPLRVFFSFGAIQGLVDPMTPLGRAMIYEIFAVGQGLVGIRVTPDKQTILFPAGERLWSNITTLLRNSVGRDFAFGALDLVEPSVKQAVVQVIDDPRLQPERQGIRFKAKLQIARLMVPVRFKMALNLISANAPTQMIVDHGEKLLEIFYKQYASITGNAHQRLAQQVDLLRDILGSNLPETFRLFVSGVASGMASLNLLRVLSQQLPEGNEAAVSSASSGGGQWSDLVLEMVRGVLYNPTTEMDLSLWHAAQSIHQNSDALKEFQTYPAHILAQRFQSGEMNSSAQKVISAFMEKYGNRGLCEIDMGRMRWSEDPTPVMDMLASYLQITDEKQAPDAVFARGRESADAALNRLVKALKKTPNGFFKARLARLAASRVRALIGMRESPKFFMVRLMGYLRHELLKTGADLVQAGEIDRADDLFFLSFDELKDLAAGDPKDWKVLISQRRTAYQRELLRRQVPRMLLSDGRAFYEGLRNDTHDGTGLTGSPVSPGVAEGSVRVVFDPRDAQLKPGEILVCPGTDPSWTLLFLSAAGLIMETGGMMTHGAVVAREYGIPAVVGVDQATSRLVTGQRVRVNGSTGRIELLENEAFEHQN